jgi:hypothetical protein
MQKFLKMLSEMPAHGKGGGPRERVMCLDTGETEYIAQWARAIAEQRGAKPHSILAFMTRRLNASRGTGQAALCYGFRFAYESDVPPELLGRGLQVTRGQEAPPRGYTRRRSPVAPLQQPQLPGTTMHNHKK